MPRNGDIRGFFGKKSTLSISQPVVSSSPQPSTEGLPSSPVTPQRIAVRVPLSRDDEIKGSDEDDVDDSDDSLESLSVFIRRGARPSAYQTDPNAATTTPKAKRVASGSEFHRSPLTLQNKLPKHKFDLKSLLSHAKQDDATVESARRAQDLLREADMPKKETSDEDELDPTKMTETARQQLLSAEDDESQAGRIYRALNRTQKDDLHKRYYFFNPDGLPRDVLRSPFPNKVATGQWALLADASRREQEFLRGIPWVLVSKHKKLPDELFMWILDEICVENHTQLRIHYIKMISHCPDNIRRLVDETQLYSMLKKLGGPGHSLQRSKFELSPGVHPVPNRDWSPLVSFLQLLSQLAESMAPSNIPSAVQLLLRMSLDPIVSCTSSVRNAHAMAMQALINAFSASDKQWNEFCNEICCFLNTSVEEASQRRSAIRQIPIATPRLCELRRRLAIETLLRNPKLGGRPPGETVTFDEIFDRMEEADFKVSRSTDFDELNALVALLDIVVDDGEYLRIHTGKDADAKFDSDIDHLCFMLKSIHDKINDNSLLSRKETKSAVDGMSNRLTHTVRTRPPPKMDIFDTKPKEDESLPRQRDFMANWRKHDAKVKALEDGSQTRRTRSIES